MHYDTIVIGGGPAGMTAALNLLRGGKKVLIIEKDTFGGQIANSPKVENLPGVLSISGEEFASNFFNQICEHGAEFELEEVLEVKKVGEIINIRTNYNEYTCDDLIIAAGCQHKSLGLESEEKFFGKGVSYCAVCDGAFHSGEDVTVIGDANTALQYAILLSSYCKSVTLVALFDKLFADQALIYRVNEINNISVLFNLSTQEFYGNEKLEGIKCKNTKTNEIVDIKCTGSFVAIGQEPHNEIYKDLVELDPKGFIITDENMHTKTPHVYAVGDCRVKKYRQIATAVSDAAQIAIELTSK